MEHVLYIEEKLEIIKNLQDGINKEKLEISQYFTVMQKALLQGVDPAFNKLVNPQLWCFTLATVYAFFAQAMTGGFSSSPDPTLRSNLMTFSRTNK